MEYACIRRKFSNHYAAELAPNVINDGVEKYNKQCSSTATAKTTECKKWHDKIINTSKQCSHFFDDVNPKKNCFENPEESFHICEAPSEILKCEAEGVQDVFDTLNDLAELSNNKKAKKELNENKKFCNDVTELCSNWRKETFNDAIRRSKEEYQRLKNHNITRDYNHHEL